MPSIHILVKGKVQGVFFRATAKKVADRLSLGGWIQNNAGGDVEAVVTGTEEHLQQFIEWCHLGPAGSDVEEVNYDYVESRDFDGFSIRRR
ncbi:MAG TPA: acylphosphatase [Ferruginibacter sp.]|nr:acylphosphatase [Ferruginibacter sp.]